MVIVAFTFNSFIPTIPVIIWYLISINIFTLFIFIIDKYHSIKDRKRVPELSLYFFSFAGGILGALIAMIVTKHKIRKKLFLSIELVIFSLWMISIYYVLNNLEEIQKVLN